MKTPKSTSTDVDLTIPIEPNSYSDDDCLGEEYEPRSKDCQLCHDSTYCSVLFQKTVVSKVKQVETTHSMLDKDILPAMGDKFIQKLAALATNYYMNGDPLTVDEVKDTVRNKYLVSDEVALSEWVNRWVESYSLGGKLL